MKSLLKIYGRTWVGIAVVTVFAFGLGKILYPMPEMPEPVLSITAPSTPAEEKKAKMEKEFARIYLSTEEPVSEREKLVKDIKLAYSQGGSAELNERLDHIDKAYTYVGSEFRDYVYHDVKTGPSKRGVNTYRCTLTGSKIGMDGEYVSQDDYEVISDIDEHNKICVDRVRDVISVVNPDIANLISRIRNNEFQQEDPKELQPLYGPKQHDEISAPTAFFNPPTWFQFFARPFLLFGLMAGAAFMGGNMLLFGLTGSNMLLEKIRLRRREKNKANKKPDNLSPKSLFDQE